MQNGNLSVLKAIARETTICNGDITLWLSPDSTMLQHVLYHALDDAIEGDLLNYHSVFAIVCGVLVAAEISEDTEDQRAIRFGQWWSIHSNADPLAAFHMYSLMVDESLHDELSEAFNSTRLELPESSKILQEGKPEAGDPLAPSGSKSTKKKS